LVSKLRSNSRNLANGKDLHLGCGLHRKQADIKIDGTQILFSWPSQGQVAAHEMDKQSANYSRDYLMALLTMLGSSSEVSDITVVAQHRWHVERGNSASASHRRQRPGDCPAKPCCTGGAQHQRETFRAQVQDIGPLDPPLLVLVCSDVLGVGI
jgi:hypothetical protein